MKIIVSENDKYNICVLDLSKAIAVRMEENYKVCSLAVFTAPHIMFLYPEDKYTFWVQDPETPANKQVSVTDVLNLYWYEDSPASNRKVFQEPLWGHE